MKKSLILVGMLAIGYANAQEGKVGINTGNPKATLEVQPSAKNLEGTTNEGIVAPKLSKERIANIAEANLVEGTLVYATDTTYTGDNTKVTKITEKGYYFYDGTEWVKASGDIWVKDGANASLAYPQSNYTVKYLADGGYEKYPTNDVNYPFLSSNNRVEYSIIDNYRTLDRFMGRVSDITKTNGVVWGKKNVFKIDKHYNTSFGGYRFGTIVSEDNVAENRTVQGMYNQLEHYGNTNASTMEGLYNTTGLASATASATTLTSGFFDAYTLSDASNINNIYGLRSRIRIGGKGTISRVTGLRSEIGLRGTDVTTNIGELHGIYIGYNGLNESYAGKVGKTFDIYAEAGGVLMNGKRIKQQYGLYINGVNKTNFLSGKLGIGTIEPIAKLDIEGNSARIAGRYFHRFSKVVGFGGKEIITVRDIIKNFITEEIIDGGTELEVGRIYEIVLNSNSESYNTGSKYIVFYDNLAKEWKSKLVSSANNISSVKLAIASSGNEIEVWHEHTTTEYNIRVNVVSIDTQTTMGASLYNFGLDGAMTNLAGNVGVGTEAPTEKLEVIGNVKANSFLGANGSIFPDYVFQKYYTGTSNIKADYTFKTLSQVEDFVKINGHLPGYKSAEAIKAQGYVDLMETQLTNVEKIEELYLHSIEQDKALKAKDAKIQELEARLDKLEKLLK